MWQETETKNKDAILSKKMKVKNETRGGRKTIKADYTPPV